MSTCPRGTEWRQKTSMDFELEWPMWNSRSTMFQLVNFEQTFFSLNLGLEKATDAILTDALYGNASDNFLPFLLLSFSPSPSFLSITSIIESAFPAVSWYVLPRQFRLLPRVMVVRTSEPPWLPLAGNPIWLFILPLSWDFTPTRSNRSITSSLPYCLFLLSFFSKENWLLLSFISFPQPFSLYIFIIRFQFQITLCLRLVSHIWSCLVHWWSRTVLRHLIGRVEPPHGR